MRLVIIFLSIFTIASCSTKKSIAKLTEKDVQFYLRKGACFGKCPVYELKIYKTGYCKLFAEQNYDKLGTLEKFLSKEELSALNSEFVKSNFKQFEREYKSRIPDYPMAVVGYRTNSKDSLYTIKGKLERPQVVKDLQVLLEQIAAENDWNLLKALEESDVAIEESEPVINKNEIIIEPEKGVHLAKWFQEIRDQYGVRIIKRISPNLNYWLIGYNKNKITGEEFLKVLNADPSIKTAEFNNNTKLR